MIPVLDHGYVRLIETWGHGDAGEPEAGIVEAARQSTQGAFRGWDKDAKLLKTLYTSEPKHATPFEFAGMVIEVQAPIFVFREWHRHRVPFSYNEMSARYAPLPDLNYVPALEDVVRRGTAQTTNRQAQGTVPFAGEAAAKIWLAKLEEMYRWAEDLYQEGLSKGIPKELARVILPVGRYSKMRASANLRGWLNFLTLRLDPMAQQEIRKFAEAVGQIIEAEFPQVWSLFEEERQDGK